MGDARTCSFLNRRYLYRNID